MVKILLVVFLFLSLSGITQEDESVLYSDAFVEITATKTNCERKDKGTHIQYYYLKVKNLSDKTLSISFKREMWFNGKCNSCGKENSEHIFLDTFLPKETKEGDCYSNTSRQYRVFSKMLNFESKSVLTDFKVTNVKIVEL